ncbi:MAG: copper resistance protein CopC/CopD [Amaricoccus sp.]|nr:copper resistance protein CopC/CopD [Amaricoccus sp.]
MIAALIVGGRASAHAQLVATTPAAGAVVAEAPGEVVLEFSEPVAPLSVRWFPPDGGAALDGAARAEDSRLVATVPDGLGTGTLLLSWRVVSVDGHPIGGSYVFSVGAPTAVAAEIPAAGAARAAAVARFALTVALVLGVGGALFCRLVDRGTAPALRSQRMASWSALAVAPAAVLALGLQGRDLLAAPVAALAGPQPWLAALASPFAATVAASLAAGLAAALALRHDDAAGRLWCWVAWIAAAVSFALFGHAATAPPRWLTTPAVALHAAAFIFWIGALPGLVERAACGGSDLLPTLRRFSAIAMPLVVGLALSGATLAFIQVGRPEAMLGTAYGRLLTAKLALVAVLLLLAALNRFRLTPAIARGETGAAPKLRRSIVAELVLGLVIVGLASGFRLTPPPRTLEAAVPAGLHVHVHGRTVMADVVLKPGRAGPNTLEITPFGQDFAAMEPMAMSVALSDPARGVEPIRIDAARDGPLWRAGPVQLPHGGDWTLTLDVLISDFAKETLETTVPVPAAE